MAENHKAPSISVIVPAYNRAHLIGHTLQSLLNQTLPADEIIVVDDGSTDSTAEAAESEFSAFSRQFLGKGKLPELMVIKQKNAGPGAARNRGFAESKGEFIHFFDSDDIAAPNKHEVQVRALNQTGADIAYGPWVKGHIRERGVGSGEHGAKKYSFEPEGHVIQQKGLPKGELIKELLTRWSIVPQAAMFRRTIIAKSDGFPDDMFVAEDQLLFLRCLLSGARVVHTPETITYYRLGDASKLTESAAGHRQRVTDWLLFLQRATEECRHQGIEPRRWCGFRRRLWAAENNAKPFLEFAPAHATASAKTKMSLESFFYPALARIERWWGGVKIRLMGNRSNRSFRCARITVAQARLFFSV